MGHINPDTADILQQNLRIVYGDTAAIAVTRHLVEPNPRVFRRQRIGIPNHIPQVNNRIRPEYIHALTHEIQHSMGIGQN